jgi:hypothetical protein
MGQVVGRGVSPHYHAVIVDVNVVVVEFDHSLFASRCKPLTLILVPSMFRRLTTSISHTSFATPVAIHRTVVQIQNGKAVTRVRHAKHITVQTLQVSQSMINNCGTGTTNDTMCYTIIDACTPSLSLSLCVCMSLSSVD